MGSASLTPKVAGMRGKLSLSLPSPSFASISEVHERPSLCYVQSANSDRRWCSNTAAPLGCYSHHLFPLGFPLLLFRFVVDKLSTTQDVLSDIRQPRCSRPVFGDNDHADHVSLSDSGASEPASAWQVQANLLVTRTY